MAHSPVIRPPAPGLEQLRGGTPHEQPEIGAYCASPFGVMLMLQFFVALDTVVKNAGSLLRWMRGAR